MEKRFKGSHTAAARDSRFVCTNTRESKHERTCERQVSLLVQPMKALVLTSFRQSRLRRAVLVMNEGTTSDVNAEEGVHPC